MSCIRVSLSAGEAGSEALVLPSEPFGQDAYQLALPNGHEGTPLTDRQELTRVLSAAGGNVGRHWNHLRESEAEYVGSS
jgi:hypothetical protein